MAAKKQQSPKDNTVRFVINGEPLEIDPDDLDLGEVEDIETRYDSEFSNLHGTQATVALVYTALKRKKPATTWDDVRKIKISAVDEDTAKRPTVVVPEVLADVGTPA